MTELFLVILYLVGMIIVGIYASRKVRSISDFVNAGGSLGFWVFSLLMIASLVSGMTALGVAGLGYVSGYATWWEQLAVPLSLVLSILLFGMKLNRLAKENGILTVQDYLAFRFNDTKGLRATSAIFSAFVSAVYLIGQYVAIGIIFKIVLGWDYRLAIVISLIVTLAYVVAGGLFAVSWTSFIQGLIVIGGLTVSAILIVNNLGGLEQVNKVLAEISEGPFAEYLNKPWGPWEVSLISPLFLFTLFGLTVPLGLAVAPHIINNVMSLKDTSRMKYLPPVMFGLGFLLLSTAKIIGISGRVAEYLGIITLPSHPVIPGSKLTDAIFPVLAKAVLPYEVYVFIAVVVLAAVMSTTDRLLLTFGVNIAYDIYHNVIAKGNSSAKKINLINRAAIVCAGVLTAYIAMSPPPLIAWLIWLALGIMISTWFPTLFLSLYWRKTTRNAVLWGMFVGFISTIIVGYAAAKPPLGLGINLTVAGAPIYFPVIGFLASTVTIVVVSIIENLKMRVENEVLE